MNAIAALTRNFALDKQSISWSVKCGDLQFEKENIMPAYLTLTRADLVKLGYSPSQASRIVKLTKEQLLKQGFGWYGKKGVDRVPVEAVDAVLGLKLSQFEGAPSGLSAVKEELS